MSFWRKKDDLRAVQTVTVIDPRVGQRLNEVAARLEMVTAELERKIARLRKEHDDE